MGAEIIPKKCLRFGKIIGDDISMLRTWKYYHLRDITYGKLIFIVKNNPPKSLIGSPFRLSIPELTGIM